MGFPGTSVNDIALEELENEELEEENGGENDEDIEDTESGEERGKCEINSLLDSSHSAFI